MSRVFAYCRVSTADQHPENQIAEIKAAGFEVMASLRATALSLARA